MRHLYYSENQSFSKSTPANPLKYNISLKPVLTSFYTGCTLMLPCHNIVPFHTAEQLLKIATISETIKIYFKIKIINKLLA